MMGYERSDDYQPLFWVRGWPVDVTTLLVVLHSFALVACCVLNGFGIADLLPAMEFSSTAVLHHLEVWRVITYAFAHEPRLGFLVGMIILFLCGREVERFFGRKTFAAIYAGLVLTAPVMLLGFTLMHQGDHGLGSGELVYGISGSALVTFGVFIAFVTIYPSVQMPILFGIHALWIAVALLAIATLALFGSHMYLTLAVLWEVTLVAFLATRYASMGSDAFAFFDNLRDRFPRKTAPRGVQPRLKPRRALDPAGPAETYSDRALAVSSTAYRPAAAGDLHESVDPLLEKISKHGLASLTHSERATLERARVSLLRKERGS